MFEDTQQKIVDLIRGNYSETRLEYDNASFTPDNEEYWVKPTIAPGEARHVSVGQKQRLVREPGVVFCQILGPAYKGVGRFYEIADILAGVFQLNNGQIVGPPAITFGSPATRRVGLVEDDLGQRYQLNVEVRFEADHIVGGA